MGWKDHLFTVPELEYMSQSAFAGYGLKSNEQEPGQSSKKVAIRFRWIWVEKLSHLIPVWCTLWSQSAFAGYGLKSGLMDDAKEYAERVAIRFRWIWVEKKLNGDTQSWIRSRNPLSLDMGWKGRNIDVQKGIGEVAIRFRWIWVEKQFNKHNMKKENRRNPLSLDMGWKALIVYLKTPLNYVAIRFRWIWVEKYNAAIILLFVFLSQSAFAGYGLKRLPITIRIGTIKWSQSAFAGYGLKRVAASWLHW